MTAIGTQPKVGRRARAGPHLGVDGTRGSRVGRASSPSVHDPNSDIAIAMQQSLECLALPIGLAPRHHLTLRQSGALAWPVGAVLALIVTC